MITLTAHFDQIYKSKQDSLILTHCVTFKGDTLTQKCQSELRPNEGVCCLIQNEHQDPSSLTEEFQ